VEQAVQLAVAATKAGLAGASSDERDLFRDQLLQGKESKIRIMEIFFLTVSYLSYIFGSL